MSAAATAGRGGADAAGGGSGGVDGKLYHRLEIAAKFRLLLLAKSKSHVSRKMSFRSQRRGQSAFDPF